MYCINAKPKQLKQKKFKKLIQNIFDTCINNRKFKLVKYNIFTIMEFALKSVDVT